MASGPIVVMILIGAALLYGDGIITPAISVLGAAEGFNLISPGFTPYVPVMACAILAALFWFQHKGTKSIGGVFGPVMLAWFAALGALGALAPLQGARCPAGPQPRLWPRIAAPSPSRRSQPARLHRPRDHRSRGPLRRHGALRPPIHRHRLVRRGVPGPCAQLFRSGRLHPASSRNDGQSVLRHGPCRLGKGRAHGAVHRGRDHREPGPPGAYSLTRQAIQLGYFPRLKINYTNIEQSGTDLRAIRQLAARHRLHPHRGALRVKRPARLGLWHSGHRNDGYHHRGLFHRGPPQTGAGRCGRSAPCAPFS
jgi:KUP system potassium uptake protein